MEITKKQQYNDALRLYLQGTYTNRYIAKQIGIRPATITEWIHADHWDEKRNSPSFIRLNQVQTILQLLTLYTDTLANDPSTVAPVITPIQANTIAQYITSLNTILATTHIFPHLQFANHLLTILLSTDFSDVPTATTQAEQQPQRQDGAILKNPDQPTLFPNIAPDTPTQEEPRTNTTHRADREEPGDSEPTPPALRFIKHFHNYLETLNP